MNKFQKDCEILFSIIFSNFAQLTGAITQIRILDFYFCLCGLGRAETRFFSSSKKKLLLLIKPLKVKKKMSYSEVFIFVGINKYRLELVSLTLEALKKQLFEVTKDDNNNNEKENMSIKITDVNSCAIETDAHLQQAIQNSQFHFIAYFQQQSINELQLSELTSAPTPQHNDKSSPKEMKEDTPETLDFKKHWNMDWIMSNVEAAIMVEKMKSQNKQGLIMVIANKMSDIMLNNEIADCKEFQDYRLYVIKQKVIKILSEIDINGNMYAIDCKIECQHNINISTQLFVTDNVIIDYHFIPSISPILWNRKFHHDIPVELQSYFNRTYGFSSNDAIFNAQKALELCLNNFKYIHAYVANSYSSLGIAYSSNREHNKARECYEKALDISLHIFGNNHGWIANLYQNYGNTYYANSVYEEVIKYYSKSLEIKIKIFGTNHINVARFYAILARAYRENKEMDKSLECSEKKLHILLNLFGYRNAEVDDAYANLGSMCKRIGKKKEACKYLEESWKIRTIAFGEFHPITRQVKKKILQILISEQ
ncbi:hypothetical protein RFI_23655 [Reticulomyxa filosa]|uniref:Uncharacterized protein n=1 Tax=Reticulomyxa filosa TaxID=46433 RepID=X6MI76_RETFI|nr:hypothetical protein RFI_23655 [Reticulomyxa filosa]|eukprot:ETO13713.1 hypothetical protein RFI_23655 [Reticulomyxa filosa]